MNYVLRRLMLDFLVGRADAGQTNTLYLQQMENYPKENLYAMLNLAGSHDVERVLSVLDVPVSNNNMENNLKKKHQLKRFSRKKQRRYLILVQASSACYCFGPGR